MIWWGAVGWDGLEWGGMEWVKRGVMSPGVLAGHLQLAIQQSRGYGLLQLTAKARDQVGREEWGFYSCQSCSVPRSTEH